MPPSAFLNQFTGLFCAVCIHIGERVIDVYKRQTLMFMKAGIYLSIQLIRTALGEQDYTTRFSMCKMENSRVKITAGRLLMEDGIELAMEIRAMYLK